MIAVSIVSHSHGLMVNELILQLGHFPFVKQIILTLNIPDKYDYDFDRSVQVIRNLSPIGFGENHNNAYKFCNQPYFCVLNPDVEIIDNPFNDLLKCMQQNDIALVSPIIVTPSGQIEDNARKFPTKISIIKKFLFSEEGRWPLDLNQPLNYPDWVAGMFMLFSSPFYKKLGGFDERYFLYYEDVDICRRIRSKGYQIALCTQVKVIHNAQRTSRKNIKFMFWHLKSLFRFLFLNTK